MQYERNEGAVERMKLADGQRGDGLIADTDVRKLDGGVKRKREWREKFQVRYYKVDRNW